MKATACHIYLFMCLRFVMWLVFRFLCSKTPSDFEQVKRGTRTNDARMDDRRPNLSLGNRFDGLRS